MYAIILRDKFMKFPKTSQKANAVRTGSNRLSQTTATILVAIIITFSMGVMNPIEIKAADTQPIEKDECGERCKPGLVLYEKHRYGNLVAHYKELYGKEYDPKDTLFFYNPDRTMIDTNSGYMWAKRYFRVYFTKNIIPRSENYPDNRLIYYTIDDILPKYKSTIEGFRKLQEKFGKFRFVDTWTVDPDTMAYGRSLDIEFDNYVLELRYDYTYVNGYIVEPPVKYLDRIDLVRSAGYISTIRGTCFNTGGGGQGINNNMPQYYQLLVRPNESSEQITIYLPEKLTLYPHTIHILDTSGNIIKCFTTDISLEQDINISSLPTGKYIIQVDNYRGIFIRR